MEVVGTAAFREWFEGLDDRDTDVVVRLVDLLEVQVVDLEAPYSSALRGSQFAMRELRSRSRARPLRVFYVFDPERNAVVLTGGDKSGYANARSFYREHIPLAEAAYGATSPTRAWAPRRGRRRRRRRRAKGRTSTRRGTYNGKHEEDAPALG